MLSPCYLIFIFTDIFERFSAEYDTFWLDSETPNYYALHLTGYSGDAGDGLSKNDTSTDVLSNGKSFTTTDVDNDNWLGKN